MTRGPVDTARLIWAARSQGSQLHRLAVDSARLDRERQERLTAADARVYRCPGCGDWRYDIDRWTSFTCSACGARKQLRRAA